MLSVSTIGSSSGAASYYGKDDYYVTGEADGPGLQWGGKGSASLGLRGTAEPKDLREILDGSHPVFIETKPDGSQPQPANQPKHKPGWDLTFSAPKSVSLAILVGGDTRLDLAHDRAVQRAMDYAERHFAITRVRQKGKAAEVKTGNLVYAKTMHGTSRSGDPQRHTHVVVANATVEPKSGKVRALESLQIFKHTKLLGRVYRAELAKEALALGYDIRHDAKTGAFELADFSQDLLRTFSKRREQIEAATIIAEQKKGGPLTAAQRDALALKDRPSKIKTSRSDLLLRWEAAAKAKGLDAKALVATIQDKDQAGSDLSPKVHGTASDAKSRFIEAWRNLVGSDRVPQDPYGFKSSHRRLDQHARSAVSYGLQVLDQQKAVFTRHEVIAKALEYGAAGLTSERLERQIGLLEADGRVQRVDGRLLGAITTSAALSLEQGLVDRVSAGKTKAPAILGLGIASGQLNALERQPGAIILNQGQRAAAEKFLTSHDRFVGVQGFAGVGKTTMFKIVNHLALEAGTEIRGLAPTHDASRALEAGAGIKSQTVESFLVGMERKLERSGQVKSLAKALDQDRRDWKDRALLVDESSLLSNRQVERLMKVADGLTIGRVIFIGDERQLGSPEAGAPWRLMLNEGIDQARMTQIQRQRDPEIKRSVEHLAKGEPGRGLYALGSRVIEVGKNATDKGLAQAAFRAWVQSKDNGSEPSIIVPTHSLRGELSTLIRAELTSRGELTGPNHSLDVLRQVKMTTAESWRASNYQEGQVLVFHAGVRDAGIAKGESLTIVGRDERNQRLVLEGQDHRQAALDLTRLAASKRANGFQTYEQHQIEVKDGERLVWERREDERGFNTGERFTVSAVDRWGWTIQAADGQEHRLKTSDPALQFVSHGYSETADRAQGQTYPNVVAVLSSAHGEAANQARAYVQISRAAQSLTFVTNDTQLLAFKLNRQDGLNLIASDEVRATREAGAELAGLALAIAKAEQPPSGAAGIKVAEPQKDREMDRVRQISRGDMSL
jgi:conjugative relaxase-like TrwC/TraI family protein